jgi:hypothetical protein
MLPGETEEHPNTTEFPEQNEEVKSIIDRLKQSNFTEDEGNNVEDEKSDDKVSDATRKQKEHRSGVEVVDVKVVPKEKKIDKFGLPINPNRKTWDRI